MHDRLPHSPHKKAPSGFFFFPLCRGREAQTFFLSKKDEKKTRKLIPLVQIILPMARSCLFSLADKPSRFCRQRGASHPQPGICFSLCVFDTAAKKREQKELEKATQPGSKKGQRQKKDRDATTGEKRRRQSPHLPPPQGNPLGFFVSKKTARKPNCACSAPGIDEEEKTRARATISRERRRAPHNPFFS